MGKNIVFIIILFVMSFKSFAIAITVEMVSIPVDDVLEEIVVEPDDFLDWYPLWTCKRLQANSRASGENFARTTLGSYCEEREISYVIEDWEDVEFKYDPKWEEKCHQIKNSGRRDIRDLEEMVAASSIESGFDVLSAYNSGSDETGEGRCSRVLAQQQMDEEDSLFDKYQAHEICLHLRESSGQRWRYPQQRWLKPLIERNRDNFFEYYVNLSNLRTQCRNRADSARDNFPRNEFPETLEKDPESISIINDTARPRRDSLTSQE